MDVDAALALTTAAASAAAGGAATAAGESAWQSLIALTRRLTGRGTEDGPPVTVDPGDEEGVRVLVGRLDERARSDEEFATQLCDWAETHSADLRVDRSVVHNTVAEGARISGPVIQARDIHGGIHLR
ncbi:hypothetical protein [Streptomyces iconiensis]|uniref:Uncharacterized protein n=1 Tax=Streptomyces iconiensis TaxID=1384038 RepID=A0ABT6ZVS3_9ACTN|nr:hypothetical protein [Streptomyces iconiensis]MDJ1133175.1 hypothetical protein [Streptomyces iconiensis]